MKSWYNEQLSLASFAKTAESLHINAAGDGDIEAFFASLALLKGLSLSQIVPDELMLPPESLRFFYVDQSWVSCFIDGALSIGRSCTKDALHDRIVIGDVIKRANAKAACLRNEFLRLDAPAPSHIRTGFLLRSQIVKGWPGLEVRCYCNDSEIDISRLDILGDSVMLCIANGEIDSIGLTEPADALHFGFLEEDGEIQQSLVSLKSDIGKSLGVTEPVVFRNRDKRVLDVSAFSEKINDRLGAMGEAGQFFSSLEFAVEMIKQQVSIKIELSGGI